MLRTQVDIDAKADSRTLDMRATGTVVTFDGFLKLYQEGRDDEAETRRTAAFRRWRQAKRCAKAVDRDRAALHRAARPRFSEASLVKRMEELGIGRPSTLCRDLSVLRDRGYVKLEKRKLYAEDKGRLVTAFLESFFSRYVEYDFTAALEEKLDRISNSELDWRAVLRDFWQDFIGAVDGIKDLRVGQVLDAMDTMMAPHVFPPRPDGSDPRKCPSCADGRLSLRLGKFGAFVGCSNYPECRFTRQFAVQGDGEQAEQQDGTRRLGTDPQTGLEVTVRDGRFGPYIQLGEGEKPKRSSIPKGMSPGDIDLDTALALLSLPPRDRPASRGPASRSSRGSASTAPMSSTARPTRTSSPATTCSRSGSIAPSS